MSRLSAFIKGLTFRTATPKFEVGRELPAIVTGRDGRDALVRIGDTVLRVDDADLRIDDEVVVRVTSFDASRSTGEATLVDGPDDRAD